MNSGDRAGQGVGIAHGNGECPYGGQRCGWWATAEWAPTDKVDVGAGLDVQRQAVRAGAIEWWPWWPRMSGTLADRPALTEALALLREGKARGLVEHRLDRLARDLVLQEQLLAECWRMGVTVSPTAAGDDAYLSDDPGNPSRRLIRQVLGAVSDYERAMVRLRLATGRRHKAHAGGYAYGPPPFGFRSERGTLVPRPDEQAALARITELHDEGTSLREIAAALANEGLAPRGGGRWHPGVLGRIVSRLPVGAGP